MHGYLLTRGWRDRPDGGEICLWAASSDGPIEILIDRQRAVCFVERTTELALPADAERRPRELRSLEGREVDAVYFNQQRLLTQYKQADPTLPEHLFESDVKPHDRYLMERFIQTGFSIEGDYEKKKGHKTYRNPKLTPAAVLPKLRIVSLDIETQANTDRLYSIGAQTRDVTADGWETRSGVVFMINADHQIDQNKENEQHNSEQRTGYTLQYVADEKTLLQKFIVWLKHTDPDILVGWAVINFDLNFLQRVHKRLNVPFDYGRGQELATILQPSSPGQPRIARLPGRAVLDGIDLLKAGFWSFNSFSLDNVAHELLGEGKLITTAQDKVAEINRLFAVVRLLRSITYTYLVYTDAVS